MASTKELIARLIQKQDLGKSEAKGIMLQALEGKLSDVLTSAWLTASAAKSETAEEISSYAEIMREKSERVSLEFDAMDTCGTGGDHSRLMNVSTLVGIVLASLKIPIAKHGNRSVSSKSGSADVLEALGYPLNETPKKVAERLKKHYFSFMFAPNFHPAMKYVAPVRKELGIRTVFNVLGPLCNPARAKVQILGVFPPEVLDIMAETLQKLEIKCGLVCTSQDGLDEISPLAQTEYRLIQNGEMRSGWITPVSGMSISSLDEIRVEDADDALEKAKKTLEGSFLPGVEVVALNAAAGLFVWELFQKKTTPDEIQAFIQEKFHQLKKHIQEKKALRVIESWKKS